MRHPEYAPARARVEDRTREGAQEIRLYREYHLQVPVRLEGSTEELAARGLHLEFTEENGRVFNARVDSDGSLDLRVPDAPLVVKTCDPAFFVVARHARIEDPKRLEVLYVRHCPTIRVLDATTKAPIKKVSLLAAIDDGPGREGTFRSDDGRYALLWGGVSPGTRLRAVTVKLAAPGYRSKNFRLGTLGAGEQIDVHLEPDEIAGLPLRITRLGEPVVGARVAIARPKRSGPWMLGGLRVLTRALTDARGRALLSAPLGEHILLVQRPEAPRDPITRRARFESGDGSDPIEIDVAESARLIVAMQSPGGSPAARGEMLVLEAATQRRTSLIADAEGRSAMWVDPNVVYSLVEAHKGRSVPGAAVRDERLAPSEVRQVMYVLGSLERVAEPRVVIGGLVESSAKYRSSGSSTWTPLPESGEIDRQLVRGTTFEISAAGVRLMLSVPALASGDVRIEWPSKGPGYDVVFAVASTAPRWVWVQPADSGDVEVRWSAAFEVSSGGVANVRGLRAGDAYTLDFEASGGGQLPFIYHPARRPTSPAAALHLGLPLAPLDGDLVSMEGRVVAADDQAPLSSARIQIRAITPPDALGGVFHLMSRHGIHRSTDERGAYSVRVPVAPRYQVIVLQRDGLGPGYRESIEELEGYEPFRDVLVR